MAKIHISLVGAQPTPVYLGIKYANPEKVILIHSSGTFDKAQKLKEEFPSLDVELKALAPVDLNEIEAMAKGLCEKYKSDELSVNITSGTKPWSYFFSSIFAPLSNAELFYVDQNCYVWNLKTKERIYIDFDIDAQFRLMGNPLEHYTDFAQYTDKDFAAIKEIEDVRRFNYNDFNSLLAVFPGDKKNAWNHKLKNSSEGKFELPSGSYVEFFKPDFVRICLLKKNGKSLTKEIKSDHAVQLCFNTNWFEVKVGKMLKDWPMAKSVYHNCAFPFNSQKDKNEVDLVVDTGAKLLFVECKTQINQTTDIDKFRTVVKNYGGQGSKGLFVIQEKFDEMALQKCEESKLLSFSLSNSNLNMSSEQALYMKLDLELFNINEK